MKREIFIHTGLPRCGSTFLQKRVFPNMDLNFTSFNSLPVKIVDGKNLISNEDLCGGSSWICNIASYKVITDRVKRLYPAASIIVVNRDLDSWLLSNYNKYFELSKQAISFSDWYDNCFSKLNFDFDSYVGYLEKRFDRVLVLDYDELKNDDVSFVGRLCDFIGVGFPVYDNEYVNISLERRHYRFLDFVDGRVPDTVRDSFNNVFRKLVKK